MNSYAVKVRQEAEEKIKKYALEELRKALLSQISHDGASWRSKILGQERSVYAWAIELTGIQAPTLPPRQQQVGSRMQNEAICRVMATHPDSQITLDFPVDDGVVYYQHPYWLPLSCCSILGRPPITPRKNWYLRKITMSGKDSIWSVLRSLHDDQIYRPSTNLRAPKLDEWEEEYVRLDYPAI